MSRDHKVYLEDILHAITKIERYTNGFSFDDLRNSELVTDAVIRNLEVIGEATRQLPEKVKTSHPQIEWRKIAGLRNILAHEYFGIDLEILWDVIQTKLPPLKREVANMLRD